MGACNFIQTVRGKSAKEAYANARQEMAEVNGHQSGYSGDIQTTSGFKVVKPKEGHTIQDVEKEIVDTDKYNGQSFEKWGDCACIYMGGGQYAFVGIAAE